MGVLITKPSYHNSALRHESSMTPLAVGQGDPVRLHRTLGQTGHQRRGSGLANQQQLLTESTHFGMRGQVFCFNSKLRLILAVPCVASQDLTPKRKT